MPKNKKLSDSDDDFSSEEEKVVKKSKKSAPPKKKKADTSDSDSGPEDRGPAKKVPTSSANAKKSKSSDEAGSWCIEGMRFAKVNEFKGKIYVNIREFYEKNGEILPGKKGISLTASQWKKLLSLSDEINAHIDTL